MKTIAKWTVEEYHRLIDTGILSQRRVELLQGEIVEVAPEGPIHTYITDGVAQYLRSTLQGLALVREAHPITLSDSEPEPDLAIVQLPRQRYRQRHPHPQDIFWLIEISQSTLAYDLNDKKKTYAQAEIPEYWVVDVRASKVHVFRHIQGENYSEELVVSQGNLASLAFPDIEISVESFWAEV